MDIVRTGAALRAHVDAWRATGETVALVPTMGALHAGHLALVERARAEAARTVVSIFVNPRQFGPNEDFDRYPRDEAADVSKLRAAGADVLFAPPGAAIYPDGYATTVHVARLGDRLDGAVRPGHFDGVATVVAKLLALARADVALFGEKDWQQLAIVRRLAADLELGTRILGCPIVRDADGLALSSRNVYLTADERRRALALPRALADAAAQIGGGAPVAGALDTAHDAMLNAGFAKIDYVELVAGASLEPLTHAAPDARLLAAAWLGKTRLIDNRGLVVP